MPSKQKLQVMLDNGVQLEVGENAYWKRSSEFQLKVAPHSFMRVGKFAVAIGDHHLAIHLEPGYTSTPAPHEGDISEKYRESFARDRRRQLGTISDALDCYGHPWSDDVRAAIEVERAAWEAMGV